MQKFTMTVHMNSREYKDGVAMDTRGSDQWNDLLAGQALILAKDWMTGPDKDNVVIIIEAE